MTKYIFLGLAGIIFALFISQNNIAYFAWKTFQSPKIALRFVRTDATFAFEIGEHYFGGGEYDLNLAEVAYKKTLVIDPQYRKANYQLARVLFVKGQTDMALDAINRELEADPQNFRSYYVRGLIYGFAGKLAEAEDDFRKFTAWAPAEWAGYNDLSWILSKEGKFKESADNILLAFKNVPDGPQNAWLQNSLGVAYLNLKEYKKAEFAFRKAEELTDGMPLSQWMSAYPGNRRDEAERGLITFKAAIKANLSKVAYLDN